MATNPSVVGISRKLALVGAGGKVAGPFRSRIIRQCGDLESLDKIFEDENRINAIFRHCKIGKVNRKDPVFIPTIWKGPQPDWPPGDFWNGRRLPYASTSPAGYAPAAAVWIS